MVAFYVRGPGGGEEPLGVPSLCHESEWAIQLY